MVEHEKNSQWQNQGFPKGEEYWKYTSFSGLEKLPLRFPEFHVGENQIEALDEAIKISWNNFSTQTHFVGATDLPGLQIYTIPQVMSDEKKSREFGDRLFQRHEANLFSKMGLSFLYQGLVLNVSRSLQKPVYISINLNNLEEENYFLPISLQINVAENQQAKIFIEVNGKDFNGFMNINYNFHVQPQAHLKVYLKEKGGPYFYSMANAFSDVEDHGSLEIIDMTFPGLWTRHNSNTRLKATGAEVSLNGVYLNSESDYCDHHTSISHLSEKTKSEQVYKGILAGCAKGVFNGKVFIAEGARQSQSQQINKNLLLSKQAEVATKPELQIFNDDVKATHGATVGQIDTEQLFYLQTRGYNREQALRALNQAFLQDVFAKQEPLVKEYYAQDLKNCLTQVGQ